MNNRILRAAAFATLAHDGQRRKYIDEPYIMHCFRVAKIISKLEILNPVIQEDMVITALLHDTVEDCNVTFDDISKQFDPIVSHMVWELTDPPKEAGNRASRKAMTIERFKKASWMAHTIKCADLIDNAESIVYNDSNFGPRFLQEKEELLPILSLATPSLYQRAWDELNSLKEWNKVNRQC